MRKLLLFFAAVGLMAGFAGRVMAQNAMTDNDNHHLNLNIGEIALLAIYGSGTTDITLAPTTTTPGTKIAASDNTALYLNVSSVVTSAWAGEPLVETVDTRSILVKADVLVPGFDIKVAATKIAGGEGTFGSAQGTAFALTTSDQPIVTGIGSCWTDVDAKGYQLTYSLVTNTYANLRVGNNLVHVTYTLTE